MEYQGALYPDIPNTLLIHAPLRRPKSCNRTAESDIRLKDIVKLFKNLLVERISFAPLPLRLLENQ